MALSDVETKLGSELPWRTCAVCHHMSVNGDEWAKTLRRLLSDRGVKFKDLARALAEDPDEPAIEWQALSRHARGGCSAKESLR